MVLLLAGTCEYNSTGNYVQSTQRWLYGRLRAMYTKMGTHVHAATFLPLCSDARVSLNWQVMTESQVSPERDQNGV